MGLDRFKNGLYVANRDDGNGGGCSRMVSIDIEMVYALLAGTSRGVEKRREGLLLSPFSCMI